MPPLDSLLSTFLLAFLDIFVIGDHPMGCFYKNVIPYEMDSDFDDTQKARILMDMKQIEDKTCVKFLNYTDKPKSALNNMTRLKFNHINDSEVEKDEVQCWHYEDDKSINFHDECFLPDKFGKHSVMHEIMHSMGFHHEHQRADRDCYVNVNPQVAKTDRSYTIRQMPDWILRFPYDKFSVTHYLRNDDIEAVNATNYDRRHNPVGNRSGNLTQFDVWKIKYKFCDAPHFCDVYPDECEKIEQFEKAHNCSEHS